MGSMKGSKGIRIFLIFDDNSASFEKEYILPLEL